jgi:hypothetical protein
MAGPFPDDKRPARDERESRDDRSRSRSPVENVLERTLVDDSGLGRPLSHRAATTQRTVEAYLKAGVRPRWMERVVEIDQGIAAEKRRLERAYRALQQECGRDGTLFARAWRDVVRGWRFDPALNGLIEQHNEWYPVERRLPMNPRTGDYVPVGGRSYRRPVLGPEWAFEQFPASSPAGA